VGLKLSSDIKCQKYKEYSSKIYSMQMNFDAIMKTYKADEPRLLSELKEFIKEYKKAPIELELATQLSQKFADSESLIDTYITILKRTESDGKDLQNSVHKAVYDLYLFIMKEIAKVTTLMQCCFALKSRLEGKRENLTLYFIATRTGFCGLDKLMIFFINSIRI
jgi:hypothetical protein